METVQNAPSTPSSYDWRAKVESIKKKASSLRDDRKQSEPEELELQLYTIVNTLENLCLDVKGLKSAVRDQDLNRLMKTVESAVHNQTQVMRDHYKVKANFKCLRDLYIGSPEDSKEDIERENGGLLKDSYSWILDHDDFRRFNNSPASRLLWVNGEPRTGKTMLLCGIIDELKKKPSLTLSYFFFRSTEDHQEDASSALRGIIWLLCANNMALISYVREHYDNRGNKLFEGGSSFTPLACILKNMLQDPCLRDCIIIIDALDECSDDTRKCLINLIVELSTSFPAKWIVSSRSSRVIKRKFRDAEGIIPLKVTKDSISQAVNFFIHHRVDEMKHSEWYDPKIKEVVLENLLLNANGSFLWVDLVCKYLKDCAPWHARKCLSETPPGVNELYKRMLRPILILPDGNDYQQILAKACIKGRPLTLDELPTLVPRLKKFSQETLKEIIGNCGSFLTLTQDTTIDFLHPSARDYLMENAKDFLFPDSTKV
ncbi:hypothetical protein AK830_g2592 [Neonectria ditissima]|uniref:NACHT domain-containing protein n=1 Tax=Neonectria ditissima TaxID=78410 RepID=A0A0N8H895_9HYPO|nr:hypothetical protein AK830_g2592 [Neonectria ditissima]